LQAGGRPDVKAFMPVRGGCRAGRSKHGLRERAGWAPLYCVGTLNALLDAEADRLCNAQRYERSAARRDTRAGH
jgi:hypothetical protein